MNYNLVAMDEPSFRFTINCTIHVRRDELNHYTISTELMEWTEE